MKYKLAIFDFDGTLADSFPWFLSVFDRIADRYRFRRIERPEIEAVRGYSARQLVRHLGVPAWKLPLIARHMRRLMAADIAQIALFPGVDRLLRGLVDRGVRLAIVSSNSTANVRRVLGPANAALIEHFGCGASMFGKRAKLRSVLRRSGVPASAAISIGDELRDLQASRAAGITFGAVSWGYTDPRALRAHAPDEIFANFEDILDRLT
jgi:phosphoglycolate phosphatase